MNLEKSVQSATLQKTKAIDHVTSVTSLFTKIVQNILASSKNLLKSNNLYIFLICRKIKLENHIYSKIRAFPQLTDPDYAEGLKYWICQLCSGDRNKEIKCHFCGRKKELMARIKFEDDIEG